MNSGAVLAPVGTRYLGAWKVEDLQFTKYDDTQLDGKVALITLSNPTRRNAYNEIMRNEIWYLVEKANRDPKIRVIMLTGDPAGKCFTFGADLSANTPSSIEGDVPMGRPRNQQYFRESGGHIGLAIVNSVKPVMAAINGTAVGIGMSLTLCCDIVICDEDAQVGFVFGKRGLTLECLSSYFLERAVGYKAAMELALTARTFKAKNAPTGLFNHVVPQDKVMSKALEIAAEICETSPMSCMYNRNMIIRTGYDSSPEDAHLLESKTIYECFQSGDFMEGVMSFLQKRKPEFKSDPIQDAPSFFPWWRATSVRSRL